MDPSAPAAQAAAALEVSFDGHHYHYRQYRYESMDDALRYARCARARPGFLPDPGFQPQWLPAWLPAAGDVALMRTFGIVYEQGYFRLGPYRYERLADAIGYAGLAQRAPPATAQ